MLRLSATLDHISSIVHLHGVHITCKMAGSELLGNYWEESRQVSGKVVIRRQSYSRSPVCVWCMVS